MIERISDLMIELDTLHMGEKRPNVEESQMVMLANEAAKAKYPTLTKTPLVKKTNLGVKLAEYHIITKDSLDKNLCHKILEKLQNMIFDDSDKIIITNEFVIEKLSQFNDLLSEMEVTFNIKDIEVDTAATNIRFMKVMQLDLCPPLTQIGMGKTEAEATFNTLSQMIHSLILFLL